MSQEERLLQGGDNSNIPSSDRVDRSDIVPIITDDGDGNLDLGNSNGVIKITRKYVPVLTVKRVRCGVEKKRYILLCVGSTLICISLILMVAGTIRFHQCQPERLKSFWDESYLRMNIDKVVSLNNYALEKPTVQSSTAVQGQNGYSKLAVDGDLQTCSRTDQESSPWWRVDLGTLRPIQYIMISGKKSVEMKDLTIYVETDEPTSGKSNRTVCHNFNGMFVNDNLITKCNGNTNGRYVMIQLIHQNKDVQGNLVLCEVIVTQR